MRLGKYVVLELLLLGAMLLCANATMEILNSLFHLRDSASGFEVGFFAWLGLSGIMFITTLYHKRKQYAPTE